MDRETEFNAAIEYATAEGKRAGKAAASWVELSDVADARRLLQLLDDGDPVGFDGIPHADLSGEYADTLTGPQLVRDALDAADVPQEDGDGIPAREWSDWFTEICDAYETAFNDAASDAVQRRLMIATGHSLAYVIQGVRNEMTDDG